MSDLRIVLDTNVLVAALRSAQGASHKLLMAIDTGKYVPVVSTPLVLEYENVLCRFRGAMGLSAEEIGHILDYVCANAVQTKIHYLWRPALRDPVDDMLLELAVAAGARYIITFNLRDFEQATRFGVKAITPQQALKEFSI